MQISQCLQNISEGLQFQVANLTGKSVMSEKYFRFSRGSVKVKDYATSRKVEGSRPDEVNEFFQFT
jgi:hypothetical protein